MHGKSGERIGGENAAEAVAEKCGESAEPAGVLRVAERVKHLVIGPGFAGAGREGERTDDGFVGAAAEGTGVHVEVEEKRVAQGVEAGEGAADAAGIEEGVGAGESEVMGGPEEGVGAAG